MKLLLTLIYIMGCGIFSVTAQYNGYQQPNNNNQYGYQSSNNKYQRNNTRFIYGIGRCGFTDIALTPIFNPTNFNPNSTNYNQYGSSPGQQVVSISYATFSFQLNTLLKEINDDNSISLNIAPALRFSIDNFGYVSSALPITLNYNSGLLSSFNSTKAKGFTVGLGALIQTTALIQNPNNPGYGPYAYAQACFQVGYRYSTRNAGRASEINFQLGYFQYKPFEEYTNNNSFAYSSAGTEVNTSASFKLTFITYLNY